MHSEGQLQLSAGQSDGRRGFKRLPFIPKIFGSSKSDVEHYHALVLRTMQEI